MKFSLAVAALVSGAVAAPSLVVRQSVEAITDSYSFQLTLAQFTAKRDARDPATLIWDSDGCTSSPDNPLGFNFVPACARHDFGYHNFRDQSRFTESNKLKIDDKFKADLYLQCESESVKWLCTALADVYYAAVRAFGGDDATPGKRAEDLVAIYEEKLATYESLLQKAKDEGLVPAA